MADEKDTTEDIENARQAEDADEAPEAESGDVAEEGEAPAEGEEQPKEKKKKKVVRRRKTKRERENALTAAVRLAVESGKVEFGARTAIVEGNAKLFVVAANAPAETRAKVENNAKKSKIPVIEYDGNTMELGSVCGKPFPVSVLSVYEEGTSNILELAKKK